MKKNLKLLTIVSALIVAVSFTTCKQFREDPEEMLSYWTSEVIPKGFSISGTQTTNSEGILCIPSASDVTLTINLHNPRKFKLVMPTNSADAHNIITFPGFTATSQPAYGSTGDYTLTQTADDKLELTYKSSFLKKHEWSSKNIGPEITFISTDGRKFSKKFSLNLKVDTPPKLSSTVTIGKTASPIGSKYYYVIILKAEDMSETAGTPSGLLHKEIKTLSVTPGTGSNTENISFTPGHTAFAASGRLLAATNVTQITSTDLGGQEPPPWESTFNADPWALRYRTDTEVKTASKAYTFTLIDEKGLKSSPITVSTPVLKAKDVQLFYGTPPDSIPAAAAASPPPNPYTINAGSSDTDVTVTAETATPGAKITGKVEKEDGSLWVQVSNIDSGPRKEVDIRLLAPESNQEILYKISLTAGGDGFATGTEKTFFVKVTKHTTITINGSESDAWKKLKTAVEKVNGPSKIIISGTITAPSGAETITVNRAVTIQGSNKASDKLNANNQTYIFDISGNGNLKLEKLTLQRGKNTDTYRGGGAIYCAGATLTTDNVIIESCEATKHGGAIYAKEVFVSGNAESSVITLKNTQIKSCAATGTAAGEGRGGAIYCKESTLTLDHTTIGGNAPTDGNTAKKGGGIYFAGGSEECTIPSGCTIQHNKTTDESGATSGGGGVYVQSGTLTLGGTISDNSALVGGDALASGGGVFVGANGTFIMKGGATISGNKAKWGGGVYIYADSSGAGSFTMEGGTISGCHAGGSGYSSAKGGGVCIKAAGAKKGSFTMQGGTITGCTATVKSGKIATGGGVYVEGTFIMKDGATISGNHANGGGAGGGVYVDSGEFTMKGGEIKNNNAQNGGGVYINANPAGVASFKMEKSATVTLSKGGDANVPGKNDVYLHDASDGNGGYNDAAIIVTGELANNPVARLTMRDSEPVQSSGYINGRNVVKGIKSASDAAKFQVTPRGSNPKNWKLEYSTGNGGVGVLKKQ